ncbi:NAD(P)-dependent dehydrogenase, short-chain alcohol dehydrogenase family [Pseudooceanicola nitratireducens]|jgi:NAD(P)-dependent dehydrogenase (short-subunit alcohol dehydrogenase family)|uniref:NAD(P)-dependent dehydrogenase, short-chain alcohol dehydrogenase family n=1 Tax=Pseudooceanicola nitratireducens TaxID=517719 RepID=A0A1I1NVZ2_9RHOB|nr:SDR family NAD(P)-dependent oxidoreductase [Pseudooceanicola nitratireducens]SEI64672.1 NAD(P)-dependent dehydrogenase, short-chain alcohol dehydrogenase family [Pseudooceanicola nitratireducens]SFD01502.1 NAD(P)-dependent dehydrogenase, short-chain alcohol dehydrogenase family [Pseudooceanicola nitratireducens]
MDGLLKDKVMLVTGAGGGIGRDIALAAARAGAAVVVNDLGASLKGDRENSGAADKVVAEIEAEGGRAIANGGSVSDPDAARQMVKDAVEAFGRLDAVVNNAGILRDGFFHKMTYEDFDAVVKVHLYGAFNTSRAAADQFREQNGGALIHMTSTSGLIGNLAQANYSAAKLGIAALSKSIALDLARWNVTSNCIAPFAWSRMTSSIKVDSPEQEARVKKLQEMKPAKIAPLAVYLASDRARDVTGQVFASRNNELFVMSQPRPVKSVHRAEGWTPETVADHAMPALRAGFMPLDVSGDVFSWDPI